MYRAHCYPKKRRYREVHPATASVSCLVFQVSIYGKGTEKESGRFPGWRKENRKSKLGRDIEIIIEKKASQRENTTGEYESEYECEETIKG